MAMGIVSDKDFNLERSKLNVPSKEQSVPNPETNTIEGIITEGTIVDITRGRPSGALKVPNGLRQLIGEESAINGRDSALELASQFGISPSSVSAYNKGATSTASYDETPNKPHIDTAKQRVSNRARTRLMSALRHITEDKLEISKATELADIANKMSAVIKNMEPESNKNPNPSINKPTFIFYSPQMRKEEHYDVVHMKE